ncbi:WD40-repeat-containing domain protein [Xylariaceae sp. FL1272]|nr:WD40-repeat-containing domain protein [Xylariaceae sp. FL1272]
MSAPHRDENDMDEEPELLDAEDAAEEYNDGDGDIAMDSDDEDRMEINFQNDSIAYFDAHKDSIFAIAQHPTQPSFIATGGGEGEGDDAPGKGYVFDTSPVVGRPVLPASYNADPSASQQQSTQLQPLFEIDGHTDSISALAFTFPNGDFLVSSGMDGRLRAYQLSVDGRNKASFTFVGEAQEVPEINWLAPCPVDANSQIAVPNTVALGASDGSVWVYTIDASDKANPLQIVQSYFLHTESCTAGAWSPDGKFLATVSEDSTLNVWDVWGEAAAKGLTNDNGQTVVSLTPTDQRFAVEGGLYSVAIDPKTSFVAVGGAGGAIKIVNLPRLGVDSHAATSKQSKSKAKGAEAGGSQGGTILADIHTQADGIETLSFSPNNPLLAAGSVDGSIAIYDTSRRFAVRRHIKEAHFSDSESYSVVKVDFVKGLGDGWLLTSCGTDGAVRRWDVRGAAGSSTQSMVKEWKGHRGEGEGGGVLGFVQGNTGERIVTAGDDGVALVFEA